jgi:competence protein ComEA
VLRSGWVPRTDLGLPLAGRADQDGEEPDVALLDRSLRGDEDTDRMPPGPAGLWRRIRWDPSRRAAVLVVVIAVLAAAVTGVVVWHARPVSQPVASLPSAPAVPLPTSRAPSAATGPDPATAGATASASRIAVAVAGKVRHPGVVELPPGSRVVDAIAAAGGLSPGAHLGLLNLAKVLTDGEQVVVGVPGVTGAAPPGDGGASGAAGSTEPAGPVNLNTATLEQLETLPGVGPSTAQKILDWRTSNGAFQSVDQLQDISGIGPAKYAAISPKATVG